jgi:hypothetical protein
MMLPPLLPHSVAAASLLLQMVTAFGPKGLLSSDKRVVYAGGAALQPADVVANQPALLASWLPVD